MNDDLAVFSESSITPESIQNKADILESNIYKDLKKSDSDALAQLHIDRTNTINPVIEKAVGQILFRFNIHPSILGNRFSEALINTQEKDSKPVIINQPIQAIAMNMGDRTLEMTVGFRCIDILIKGVSPQPEQHEEIVKYYFEPEKHPGKLLPNGKIDFRELHQFPSVKMGDKLMFIKYPVPGKAGITFEGKIIPVSEPLSLDLEFKEGVIKQNYLDKNGKPVGYFLTAAKTGVIILKRVNRVIREIDVTDRIELETIDYSIGNIGSEFISPVSMKIGTIKDGFRIKAHGQVEVQTLDGGHVVTDDKAMIEHVRPNSTVNAVLGVTAKLVVDSDLTSSQGAVTIIDELRDSRINAGNVLFKSTKGSMLNSVIDACTLEFNNVYYCGVNKIYLGRDAFKNRLAIIEELEKVDKGNKDVQDAIDYIKEKLMSGLKNLASQISDDSLLNMFKLLIHSLQTFTFSDSFKVLDNLRSKMNVMQIDQLKKTFEELEKLSKAILAYSNKKKELSLQLQNVDSVINGIRCTLTGKINPTATIQIYCSKKASDDPVHEIKPVKKDTNETLSFTAVYNIEYGFKVL